MKFRFFLEHATEDHKARGVDVGNVQAVGDRRPDEMFDGYGSLAAGPNGSVQRIGVTDQFLERFCVEITEARAREVHPALFEVLDGLAEDPGDGPARPAPSPPAPSA